MLKKKEKKLPRLLVKYHHNFYFVVFEIVHLPQKITTANDSKAQVFSGGAGCRSNKSIKTQLKRQTRAPENGTYRFVSLRSTLFNFWRFFRVALYLDYLFKGIWLA